MGQIAHALLTRPPLKQLEASSSLSPLDLHVLGTPPAFVLSQDQTLMFNPHPITGANRLSAFLTRSESDCSLFALTSLYRFQGSPFPLGRSLSLAPLATTLTIILTQTTFVNTFFRLSKIEFLHIYIPIFLHFFACKEMVNSCLTRNHRPTFSPRPPARSCANLHGVYDNIVSFRPSSTSHYSRRDI